MPRSFRSLLLGYALLFTLFRMARLEGWDDAFYMGQMTSLFADSDLMLQNDLLAFQNPLSMRFRGLTTISDSGALLNTFAIGPGVVHASYLWPVLRFSERPMGPALRYGLAVGSMALLIFTVLATRALVRRMGFEATADLATALAVLGGPLALYGTRSYLNSHLPGALLTAGVILAFWSWLESRALWHAALSGLFAGLLVINRWQDVALLLGLIPALAVSWREEARRDVRGLGVAALVFAAIVSIQSRAWYVQFGSPFLIPQGSGYMNWTRPRVLPFLLSGYHGLVPWAPAFAAGLVSLSWAWRRSVPVVGRWLLIGFALVVPLMIYLSACPYDWWGGESYGPRRLASLTPLAAVGLAPMLERFGRPVRVGLTVLVIGWMAFTTSAYFSGFDDLAVVFTGRTDPANPAPGNAYRSATWIDRPWTLPRILRPGFTFSDQPGWSDRGLGAITVFLVAGVAGLIWRGLARSVRARQAALTAALAWVAVVMVLVWRVPGNAAWNREWREVVRGQPPRPPEDAFPKGVDEAAALVRAVHAFAADRGEEGERFLARIRDRESLGLDREAVLALARGEKAAPAPPSR